MIKKRGRNIIIRRDTIKASSLDTSLFDEKVYDEDITRVIVKSDFDFDDDMGPHFSEYPNLKEFRMAINHSEFEVHDDIMYMRLSENAIRKSIGWNCGFFDYNNNVSTQITEGLVLVCCPPKINHKDIVLHKDCTVIYGSAFEGCNLNSLTISSSFPPALTLSPKALTAMPPSSLSTCKIMSGVQCTWSRKAMSTPAWVTIYRPLLAACSMIKRQRGSSK